MAKSPKRAAKPKLTKPKAPETVSAEEQGRRDHEAIQARRAAFGY